ncbi:MAG: nitroreductase family protein [Acidobacteriota bacterium]
MTDHEDGAGIAARYHSRTEHRLPNRFARSLGHLEWATQPDPFRCHDGAELIELPRREPDESEGPDWASIRSDSAPAPAPLDSRSFSQLLYDSLAISAWKQAGPSKWALRCNPSSGNLHPTEAYFIVDAVRELIEAPALLHYAPKDHAVEIRRSLSPSALEELSCQLPEGAFVLGLSSVAWREAWKYGERAFRYCMHDVGHAMEGVAIAARILGWRARRIEGLTAEQLDRLIALDGSSGPEAERADVLLAIETTPTPACGPLRVQLSEQALDALSPPAEGTPNQLSSRHHDWPILQEVEQATRDDGSPQGDVEERGPGTTFEAESPSSPARVLVRKRRSAVDFDGETTMERDQLYRMLATLVPALTPSTWTAFPHRPRIHPLVFLHRIDGLDPGLAILVRDPGAEPLLRQALSRVEEWSPLPGCPDELPLFRLASGDTRNAGRIAHCHQDIGADGTLVVSMLTSFDDELASFGPAAYRHLHWEAGALGHLLYLEAEALSLSATGIGCFFDHAIHDLVGLTDGRFRMLYGTAVGRAVLDPRIQTLPAYD